MPLLLQHWSFDPFLVVALAAAFVHERGLRRINRRSSPARARRRRRRSWWFYAGLAVLLLAVESPVDYWADSYFWVHMIQHLLLIFAAPPPIVASAPWLPLQHGLPARPRRAVSRFLLRGGRRAPQRRLGRWLLSPWFAVVGLNAVVIFWHMPGPLDLAEYNLTVHVWGMHASFFVFGVLFWLQLIPSHPHRPRLSPPAQIGAVFATALDFWFLAIAMSVLSSGSWYAWYRIHEGPDLTPFADQQIAAGIMWVSGLFWAFPAIALSARRLIDQQGEPGVESLLDRVFAGRRGGRVGPAHLAASRRDIEAAAR